MTGILPTENGSNLICQWFILFDSRCTYSIWFVTPNYPLITGTHNARLCPPGWFDNWMNDHIVQGFHDNVDRSYLENFKAEKPSVFFVLFFFSPNQVNCYPVTNQSFCQTLVLKEDILGCYVRDDGIELKLSSVIVTEFPGGNRRNA